MPLKIGFFSLEEHIGCTSIAIHTANYLAGSRYTVALAEPEYVTGAVFKDAQTEHKKDGTFYVNNVHYYPEGTKIKPSENVQIFDYGMVNILFRGRDY